MRYGLMLTAFLMAALAALPARAGEKRALRDAHAEAVCADCHVGRQKPVRAGEISCAKCHAVEETVKRTEDRGRKNPHVSPHWGSEVPCWVCHKEHAPDRNYCLICHTW